MILSYGGRNCWAFKEWLEISFRANGNVPADYKFKNKEAFSSLCFIGANAAGKSCALKILSFIVDFCTNSFSYPIEQGILFDSFFGSNSKSDFFLEFCINDSEEEYYYEVSLDNTKIYEEQLYTKTGNKKNHLIHRVNNEIKKNTLAPNISNIILKDNSSIISTWSQYGIKEIGPFRSFFQNIITNVSYSGTYEETMSDYASKYFYNHQDMFKRVIELLKSFDTGISDIRIEKGINRNNKESFYSVFTHFSDDGKHELPYINQSTGTKMLYNHLMDFITVLDRGGVLAFDELDSHLHSDIVPMLISLFLDPNINKNNAQIVFTSHNESILNIMKKYRLYVFKKEKNTAFAYRVDELKNNTLYRNDRSLEDSYRLGQIGGRPNV